MASQQPELRHNRQLANHCFTKWSWFDLNQLWRVLLNINFNELCDRLYHVKLLLGYGNRHFWKKPSE